MSILNEVKKRAKSAMFRDLLDRLESGQYPGITVELFDRTKAGGLLFAEWITQAVSKAIKDEEQREMYVVSGEFYQEHWNSLGKSLINGKSVIDWLYDAFYVRGICCSYIDHDPDSGLMNEIFENLFQKAASKANDKIRLYCSDVREDCHWICIGNEMHVVDWHMPCEEHADKRETVVLKGAGTAAFARDEFQQALERLAVFWGSEGDSERFRHWLESRENTGSEWEESQESINAIFSVTAENKDSLSPETLKLLPEGFMETIFGEPADTVPYLRNINKGLFSCNSRDEIARLYANGDRTLCPPRMWRHLPA